MIRFCKIGVFTLGAALLPMLTLGCNDNKAKHARRDEPRKMEDQPKSIDRILEIQAAQGARNDSTLYPQHFDGGELNALGRSKLALMMRGASAGSPTIVYLDLGRASETSQARHRAVDKYWKESMTAQAHLELRDGLNPNATSSARHGLERLPKTNSDAKPESNQGVIEPNPSPGTNSGPSDTLFK